MVESNIKQHLLNGETLTHDNRQGAVSVEWKLKEGTEFKAGDYFELVFDQELLTMAPTSFDMVGVDGSVEGTCSVDNTTGKLKCTFIQDSKDSHSHQGGFTHTFSIKKDKVKNEGTPTDIEFSIGGKPNKITVGSIDVGHEYIRDNDGKIMFEYMQILDQHNQSVKVIDLKKESNGNPVIENDRGFELEVYLPQTNEDNQVVRTLLIGYRTLITDLSQVDYSNTVKVTNDIGRLFEVSQTVNLHSNQWFEKITDPAMNGKIRIKKKWREQTYQLKALHLMFM